MTDVESDGLPWEATFAEQVRTLRARRGWSQTELAKRVSARGRPFHQQQVQRIETGARPVRLNEALLLAEVFGVGLESMTSPPDGATAAQQLGSARARLNSQATQAWFDVEAWRRGLTDACDDFEAAATAYRTLRREAGEAVEPETDELIGADLAAVAALRETFPALDASLRRLQALWPLRPGQVF